MGDKVKYNDKKTNKIYMSGMAHNSLERRKLKLHNKKICKLVCTFCELRNNIVTIPAKVYRNFKREIMIVEISNLSLQNLN